MVTIEIPEKLAQEAEALGLDVANACRTGFAETMYRQRRALEWQEQHRAAIEAYNRWIEEHDLPLERYRLFSPEFSSLEPED